MLLVALLLWPVLHNLYLSRTEGLVLLAVFSALLLLIVHSARKEKHKSTTTQENKDTCAKLNMRKSVLLVVIGLVGLALGADIAVRGAVFIGERAGLSKAVIGLTIIAVGTSLPELATCLVAAFKAQHDISIGNLVGSNIFNTLLVTGSAGAIRPIEIVPRLIGVDYWIMIIVSGVFLLAAAIGRRIGRIDGIILLGGYIAYIVYLLAYTSGV
jgi:cation:H+ antiporter